MTTPAICFFGWSRRRSASVITPSSTMALASRACTVKVEMALSTQGAATKKVNRARNACTIKMEKFHIIQRNQRV